MWRRPVHRHDGLHIRVSKSKSDQEGRESVKALPHTEPMKGVRHGPMPVRTRLSPRSMAADDS